MIKEDFAAHKKKGAQAEKLKPQFAKRIHAYLDSHAHALFSSLGRLLRTLAGFTLTVFVLAVSMALAGSFYVIVKNLQQLTSTFESSNQISIFLKKEAAPDKIKILLEQFQNDTAIASVKLITAEQALEEFKNHSGFGDALKALDHNPLPPVIVVLPKNSLQDQQAIEGLVRRFQQHADVDFAQLDLQWVQRIQSIVALAERGVLLMSCLFGLAVLLVTSNTIRLELQNRREEVIIEKLVGATDAYIRRPFLYTGFWLGFSAGVVAWFVVTVIMLFLHGPVEQLSLQYAEHFNLSFLSISESLSLLGISSGLGILGAGSVLYSQLALMKPE